MKISNKKNLKNSRKKVAAICAILVILILVFGGAFWYLRANNLWIFSENSAENAENSAKKSSGNSSKKAENSENNSDKNSTSTSGKTAEDAASEIKNETENPSGTAENSSGNSAKKSAAVAISIYGQNGQNYLVNGYANVVEGGGYCTAKLSDGSRNFSGGRAATISAKTTDCGLITLENVPAGNYVLTLSYDSANYSGSATQNVEIK